MHYMILIYGSHRAWDALDKETIAELASAHDSIKAELRQSGELIATSELDDDHASVLRMVDGRLNVSDTVFSEGEQILSGYYLINCVDHARAVAIASRFVETRFAPIEVRRLGEGSTWVS